ncbi:MAG TPA: hypothetical protein VEJ63_08565 [Planctomycetota bacterium]|nr:hypothetical protein [Planctomycetota bacterium]
MLAHHPIEIDGGGKTGKKSTAVEELLATLGVDRHNSELLLMRYEQALSCNRIAEHLKLSKREVDAKLKQARQLLREKLNELN